MWIGPSSSRAAEAEGCTVAGESAARTAGWYADAVVYDLDVRAFFDGNGDGIGDYVGLSAKLDYLQDLGVTCLLLHPLLAESLSGGIVDHGQVEPTCGTAADLQALLNAAHRRGVRVLGRFAVDRTSRRHRWFAASREAPKGSSVRDCYRWFETETCHGPEGRNGHCALGWDARAKAFYCHGATPDDPFLNLSSRPVQQALLSSMRTWLELGLDGLVLTATCGPCLADEDAGAHALQDILRRICIQSRDGREWDRLFLWSGGTPVPLADEGAWCEAAAAVRRLFMSAVLHALIDSDGRRVMDVLCASLSPDHQAPVVTAVDERDATCWRWLRASDPRVLDLANSLVLSLPGPPVLTHGEEFGLTVSRASGSRDASRTLMAWSDDRNGGFSRAERECLWAPPNDDPVAGYQVLNVKRQFALTDSTLNNTKAWLALRASSAAIRHGGLVAVTAQPPSVAAFLREDEHEAVLVVANFSRFPMPARVALPRFGSWRVREMTSGIEWPSLGALDYRITLSPLGCYWLGLTPDHGGHA